MQKVSSTVTAQHNKWHEKQTCSACNAKDGSTNHGHSCRHLNCPVRQATDPNAQDALTRGERKHAIWANLTAPSNTTGAHGLGLEAETWAAQQMSAEPLPLRAGEVWQGPIVDGEVSHQLTALLCFCSSSCLTCCFCSVILTALLFSWMNQCLNSLHQVPLRPPRE